MSTPGMEPAAWDRYATAESKNAIFVWILAGVVYQIWWAGRLVSVSTFLLFMPGIFIASFAAFPIAIVKAIKTRRLLEMKHRLRRPNPIELLGWTIWWVIEQGFVAALAVLLMKGLNAILP